MKHLSAAVKVGLLFTVLVVGSYAVWKMVAARPSGASEFQVFAKFKDASGLPLGSRVVIAGLPVGEVEDLSIEGRYARITMRIREDVPLYTNAIIFKKAASLLGAFYLEIDPGGPESIGVQGERKTNPRLKRGEEITRVVEATSPEQLMRRIEESLPNVDNVLLSVKDLSDDVRGLVNGPVSSVAHRIDNLVRDESATISRILKNTDKSLERIEAITADVRRQTAQGGNVDTILNNLDEASLEAREFVKDARTELDAVSKKLQDKLDLIDGVLENTEQITAKVNSDQGTLGRLVNDSTLADNLEDITDDAKGFLGTIFGLQTRLGFRGEYYPRSGGSQFYMTVELRTRPDKFYYIELLSGPRGNSPDVTLVYDPTQGAFRQDVVIEDKFRFTFQFAKQIDWLTLRYGIKESSGGIGADAAWFDGHLHLSADLFDGSFNRLPRLKLGAALEFFGMLYIIGGVDDVLNNPDQLLINPIGPTTEDGVAVPQRLREMWLGRDYFVGAMLKFDDSDLAALLAIGGGALSGLSD